jgi:methylenetetrahydrofolate dehydrogenase (NADP+)/methenyltetrahydrofolate cyclohydrolase
MNILDGKETFKTIREELKAEVDRRKASGMKIPHLAAVLVGSDGASQTYVNSKVRDCEKIGFGSSLIRLDENTSEEELFSVVDQLNNDEDVDGFIVQLPLPRHIDEQKVTEAIDPAKDVDGFHPVSFGKMALGLDTFISATPNGVLELLRRYEISTEGKHCVVLGRSHIVGLPMSILMGQKRNPGNCTVTLAHSRTANLKEVCKSADILIVALGKAEMVDESYIKPGAVVVDVGITRVEDASREKGYRLAGDVDFESASKVAGWITPVPGGVGPMTRASLLQNTLKAVELQGK